MISVEQPDCLSAYSSSWTRYAGLMLTRIAPIFAVANWVTTHSAWLGDQMPDPVPLVGAQRNEARPSASTRSRSSP